LTTCKNNVTLYVVFEGPYFSCETLKTYLHNMLPSNSLYHNVIDEVLGKNQSNNIELKDILKNFLMNGYKRYSELEKDAASMLIELANL
jgi:hypothetical protein